MKYATPEAFRAALDQRIRNEAATSGVPVMRLRKRVASERFLARIAIVDTQRWVLKGAFALDLRLGLRTRTTKDIDLAGADDEQATAPASPSPPRSPHPRQDRRPPTPAPPKK